MRFPTIPLAALVAVSLLPTVAAFAQETKEAKSALPGSSALYPMQRLRVAPPIEIDTSDAPEAAAWAERAKLLIQEWFPFVVATLSTENWKTPEKIRLVFRKQQDAPAYAAGSEISISAPWIAAHPDDWGMVIHELTHVVQSYPGYRGKPGWLVEGIADYIRWWRYEPEAPRTRIDPEKAKYTDSYRTTAAFLAYVAGRHNRSLVPKLDDALRNRRDPLPLFQELTGKSIDTLWEEFVKTLPARR
jgi:uncharacterized membrane protein